MNVDTEVKVKRMTLEAVVTRRDEHGNVLGVENHGTIAYWDHRWYRRLWARIQRKGRISVGEK